MEQVRVYVALTFKEFFPVGPLRILPVANFEPLRRVLQVGSEFVLCYNTLQVVLAGQCEQIFPGCLDVIAEQRALAVPGQDGAQALLALRSVDCT